MPERARSHLEAASARAMDLMLFPSNANSLGAIASRPRIHKRAARIPAAGLLLAAMIMQAGCGKKSTPAPPPAPVTAEPAIEPRERPAGVAWEPQTQEKLPPPQPIPKEALSSEHSPLRIDRSEQPDEGTTEPIVDDEPTKHERTSTATEPAANPRTPFRLGIILSSEERSEYNRMIDRDLAAAEESLSRVLNGDGLRERGVQVKRVRAFMRQAEEVRGDDLPLARNLAGRARLLADDLAGAAP